MLYCVRIFLATWVAISFGLAGTASSGFAADKIRAGKATGETWGYLPLDVGVEEGIFSKYGLDIEITVLSGGARFQQALVSDSIDVGLSGTTAMAQTVKGSPMIAIAAIVNFFQVIHDVVGCDGRGEPILTDRCSGSVEFAAFVSFREKKYSAPWAALFPARRKSATYVRNSCSMVAPGASLEWRRRAFGLSGLAPVEIAGAYSSRNFFLASARDSDG